MKDWNIEALTGYKPKTTFYLDFSIAEPFGIKAITDTYQNAVKSWKTNIEYMTELSMALNWKIWEHYETNPTLGKLYNDLWDKCCTYITSEAGFTEEELSYYYSTTD